jgi:hypothetical protein
MPGAGVQIDQDRVGGGVSEKRWSGVNYWIAARRGLRQAIVGIGVLGVSDFLSAGGLVLLGAFVGYLPAAWAERQRRRYDEERRWQQGLFELCQQFTSSIRELQHHSRRLEHDPTATEPREAMETEHARIRAIGEQFRLVASPPLQRSARLLVRHAYAVRLVAQGEPDPRTSDYPGTLPSDRVSDELVHFHIEARKALHVRDAEAVARLD